ncbi:MAG: prephenate dehydrogenase [Burkholderiaceae bacterium]|jgi:prephenate dehydrogenase
MTTVPTEFVEFVPFRRLAIIGTGLMGGSLALAAKQQGLALHTVGYSRHFATAEQAEAFGVIDQACDRLSDAVDGADAIYLAVPGGQLPALLETLAPLVRALPDGTWPIVWDAGSTKQNVVSGLVALRDRFPEFVSHCVLCHPIAGSERRGPSAAQVDLYAGKTVVLCRGESTDPLAHARVESFWTMLGARVKTMPADRHDAFFAAASHLPHWLAFAYVAALLDQPDGAVAMAEGGAGFRDFTRIAASSPEMWCDIFLDNRENMLARLAAVDARLLAMRAALQNKDRAALTDVLVRAAQFRESWSPHSTAGDCAAEVNAE